MTCVDDSATTPAAGSPGSANAANERTFTTDIIESDFTRLETYPFGKRWSLVTLSGRPSPWGRGFHHHVDHTSLSASAASCGLCRVILDGFVEGQAHRVRHLGLFPRDCSPDLGAPRRDILVASFDDQGRHIDTIPKHDFQIDQIRPYEVSIPDAVSSGSHGRSSVPVDRHFERTVPPSAASEDALDTAGFWFRDCAENHAKCRSASGTLPTRVVDVWAGETSTAAALSATRGEKGLYAALTHCWGGRVPCKTTSARLKKYSESLPIDRLPQNFLDAILVTRKLGLRYLWIDALCIVQDSKPDWEAEAARMASVYDNAAVTISALSSNRSTAGFLGARDQRRVVLSPDFAAHRTLPGFESAVSGSPLSKRGWCLQERLLAPALLHFGSGQMYWECRTATWQEDGLPPFDTPRYSFLYSFTDTRRVFGLTGPRSTRDWYVLVEDFMGRALTYESDRLPALAGIASRFRAAGIGGRYVAGHWTEGLERSLFWFTSGLGRCVSVPTWSWARASGGVYFKSGEDVMGQGDYLFEVLAVDDAGRDPDDLAATTVKATIKIRGRVASMHYTKHIRKNERDIAMPEADKPGLKFRGEIAARAVLHDFPGEGRRLDSNTYSVLVDSRRKPRMILMRQARTVPGEGGEGEIPVFKRVGSAEYLGDFLEDDVLARFERQTIILA